jgi:hypothetical protein
MWQQSFAGLRPTKTCLLAKYRLALTTPESAGTRRIVGDAKIDALLKLHKPGYTPIKTKQFPRFPSLRFLKGEIPRPPTAWDFSLTTAI